MAYAKKRVEEGKLLRRKGFPYEGRPTYTVEWNEHPSIDVIDKYVVDQLSIDDQKSYFTYAYRRTNCISDFKITATDWVEDRIANLETILEMIKKLPNDTQKSYTIDEKTGEVVR